VKAALMYPGVVVTFAIVMMTLMFTFGIPQLESIYASIGAQLPAVTRIFIGLSHILLSSWYVWVPLLVAGIVALMVWKKTPRGELAFDGFMLRVYFIGPLLRKAAIARFARTLSTLYASGVPIVLALEVSAATAGNRIIGDAALSAVAALKQGSAISAALREARVFTSMTISMIGAGEQSGTLESMLERLSDFYEEQVEISTQALAGVLEPIIMIAVGLAIGTMIVVVALPFFLVGSQLH
jgi:type IV pilus assembly protein PilC